ncbi:shikimate kinase [Thermovibrio ammonificans]|uniref:Shikimate kinase n=1 Tax=Thermovibrio ammonificans (strain DSM 15698 / JCM 12110 / HB-1) TaxID=648996 RepID=E8T3B8_THEA1|nr:shikimate kinase [Thermovibrio ammonificans]ADU97250.1 Shikimate kinase [Thermovibrio ammonificans HB-1]
MKVVLVGFMGSGKSTVGKLLERELRIPLIDLDSLIEERTGKTIPQIFREEGQERFREIESQLLRELLSSKGSFIISTGGGTPCHKNNAEEINRKAVSVFLYAPFETLWERIKGDTNRPLTKLGKEKLKELYENRLPFYTKAHLTVNTEGKTAEEVAEEIKNYLKRRER